MTSWSLESSQHPAHVLPRKVPLIGTLTCLGHLTVMLPICSKIYLVKDCEGKEKRKASEDVGTLSVMLQALRDAVESYLGREISSALAATPNLVALYQEDVDDAFEYLGLESLDDPNPLFRMFQHHMESGCVTITLTVMPAKKNPFTFLVVSFSRYCIRKTRCAWKCVLSTQSMLRRVSTIHGFQFGFRQSP